MNKINKEMPQKNYLWAESICTLWRKLIKFSLKICDRCESLLILYYSHIFLIYLVLYFVMPISRFSMKDEFFNIGSNRLIIVKVIILSISESFSYFSYSGGCYLFLMEKKNCPRKERPFKVSIPKIHFCLLGSHFYKEKQLRNQIVQEGSIY